MDEQDYPKIAKAALLIQQCLKSNDIEDATAMKAIGTSFIAMCCALDMKEKDFDSMLVHLKTSFLDMNKTYKECMKKYGK